MVAISSTLKFRIFKKRDQAPAEAGVMIAFALFCMVLAIFVVYPTVKVLIYPSLSEYWSVLRGSRWLVAARNSIFSNGNASSNGWCNAACSAARP